MPAKIISTPALRPAAGAGAGPPARPRHLRLPRARPAPQGAGAARQAVPATARSARPIGPWSKAARTRTKASIDMPLGRLDDKHRLVDEARSGGPARRSTKWKVMGSRFTPPSAPKGRANLTWLALEPLTGRTHQLRVHCAEMGWPMLGDAIYGNAPRTRRAAAAPARPRNRRCRSTRIATRSE